MLSSAPVLQLSVRRPAGLLAAEIRCTTPQAALKGCSTQAWATPHSTKPMRRPHVACRRAGQAPWMGWLLCLGVLLHHPAAAVETRVSTAREFAAALVDNSTDVVVLTTDLMVNPDNWATFSQDQPCKIQRNLLITSQPSLNVLNYGFLQAKCRIQPNVTVTYADLVLSNTR